MSRQQTWKDIEAGWTPKLESCRCSQNAIGFDVSIVVIMVARGWRPQRLDVGLRKNVLFVSIIFTGTQPNKQHNFGDRKPRIKLCCFWLLKHCTVQSLVSCIQIQSIPNSFPPSLSHILICYQQWPSCDGENWRCVVNKSKSIPTCSAL